MKLFRFVLAFSGGIVGLYLALGGSYYPAQWLPSWAGRWSGAFLLALLLYVGLAGLVGCYFGLFIDRSLFR